MAHYRSPNTSTAEELEEVEARIKYCREQHLPNWLTFWLDAAKSLRSDYAREGW